ETVCGLGNRKNRLLVEQLKKHRVEVFDSSIELIQELQSKGFQTAVVSSSKNCAEVLKSAGFPALFSTKVDGNDAERLGLEGKPAPGTFLEAARRLGVDPARAIVVEDAIVGVQAGRRGNFGGVIGVDRTGQAAALQANGADVVVSDLSEVACEQ
ncbi:MAG: HAD-IA family hydrolase, partial [Acidobacteria bacterium]|nr:HAD-IA family hydrolase [Acidobacteriota bacterium]